MSIKLDESNSSFKQLEYFSMAEWEKLEILRINTQENIIEIENIEDKFDFPLLK